MGCFIPAESAEIGVVDRIFTRVGAADDWLLGDRRLWLKCTKLRQGSDQASLLILDELAARYLDGVSIAWSVAE